MFETHIARGMTLLDARRPGWSMHVDVDRLDMLQVFYYADPTRHNYGTRASCGCILAQVNLPTQLEPLPFPLTSYVAGQYREGMHDLMRDTGLNPTAMTAEEEDNWAMRHGFAVGAECIDDERHARANAATANRYDTVEELYTTLTQEWRAALLARRM